MKGKLILRGLCEPKSIFSLDFCKLQKKLSDNKSDQSSPDGKEQVFGPSPDDPIQESAKKSTSLNPAVSNHEPSLNSVRMTRRMADYVDPESGDGIEKTNGNRDGVEEFLKIGRFSSLQRALLQKSPIALIWVLQAARFREHMKEFQKAFLKYDKESKKNVLDCEKITKYMPSVTCELFKNTYLDLDNNNFNLGSDNYPKVWSRAPFPILYSPLVKSVHYESGPNANNYEVGMSGNTPKAFSRLSQHVIDSPIEAVLFKRRSDEEDKGQEVRPDSDGNHEKAKRVYDLIKQRNGKSVVAGRYNEGHTLQDSSADRIRPTSDSIIVPIPHKRLFDMMGGSNEKKIIGKFPSDDRPDSKDEMPSRRLSRPKSGPGFHLNSIQKRLFDVMNKGNNQTVADKKFVRRFQRFDDGSRAKRVYDVIYNGEPNPQTEISPRFTNTKLHRGTSLESKLKRQDGFMRSGDSSKNLKRILEMAAQNSK